MVQAKKNTTIQAGENFVLAKRRIDDWFETEYQKLRKAYNEKTDALYMEQQQTINDLGNKKIQEYPVPIKIVAQTEHGWSDRPPVQTLVADLYRKGKHPYKIGQTWYIPAKDVPRIKAKHE